MFFLWLPKKFCFIMLSCQKNILEHYLKGWKSHLLIKWRHFVVGVFVGVVDMGFVQFSQFPEALGRRSNIHDLLSFERHPGEEKINQLCNFNSAYLAYAETSPQRQGSWVHMCPSATSGLRPGPLTLWGWCRDPKVCFSFGYQRFITRLTWIRFTHWLMQ